MNSLWGGPVLSLGQREAALRRATPLPPGPLPRVQTQSSPVNGAGRGLAARLCRPAPGRCVCSGQALPLHQHRCGWEHGPTAKPLTEARDAEQEQGLPTLLRQSSHPRGWEPSPSGPMEDQIHEHVHTHGPLISQTRQAQAGLRVMKEPPASDSSLLSSGCGR